MTDEEAAEIVQRILALERKYRSAVQSQQLAYAASSASTSCFSFGQDFLGGGVSNSAPGAKLTMGRHQPLAWPRWLSARSHSAASAEPESTMKAILARRSCAWPHAHCRTSTASAAIGSRFGRSVLTNDHRYGGMRSGLAYAVRPTSQVGRLKAEISRRRVITSSRARTKSTSWLTFAASRRRDQRSGPSFQTDALPGGGRARQRMTLSNSALRCRRRLSQSEKGPRDGEVVSVRGFAFVVVLRVRLTGSARELMLFGQWG